MTAWLLLTAGDNRQHGGNSGYDDQPGVYYTWDSTVSNHDKIRAGDPIALWDKVTLLGISVIEEIRVEHKDKLLFKCPQCAKAGIKARKNELPRFKCYKCGNVFDQPATQVKAVAEYRSRHDAAWTSLENVLAGSELRLLCESPKSQLSIRQVRWSAFQSSVSSRGAQWAIDRVLHRTSDFIFPQGHRLSVVRVRRGQRPFRERLLISHGEICAFTGRAPGRALEAGHLYSYAQLGIHHEHGGLLLRRDIHRLFDDGWLAVNPDSLRIDVSANLERYDQYATLHDENLRVRLRSEQVEWLAKHWEEHRVR
ncbi:HNH endonuclease [Jiangella ureilytica]|uniref:HNH endonuclease n=1 Tax=Jiangella ureilytica TaxID=2530374 RepID=A0A4R4RTZ4_9ACTN|nr:HNH endonuclease signature motif containing protein [Jiangella ureilytica]TDC52003.1 HNH endonuclease [Jiangella ureilytica]